MDPRLILREAPALHPSWLAHEETFNLLTPKPIITDPILNQKRYSDACKTANTSLLTGRDKHLTENITISDTRIEADPNSANARYIPMRKYAPALFPTGSVSSRLIAENTVVYFHGGGLYVGDLDSEDLTCRRICKALNCTVYSCTYRKIPQFTADEALSDALYAFNVIASYKTDGKLIVMGSSSGGRRYKNLLLPLFIFEASPKRPSNHPKRHGSISC